MRKHYPLNTQGAEDAGQLPWKDGVPSTGTEGSYPGQALFVDTEAEILAAIDASGQTRNGSDLAQLVQAIARGVFVGQYSGSANALSAAIPNNVVFSALQIGTRITGFVATTNTGSVTLKIVGIGTAAGSVQAPLLRRDGAALQTGDLPVNQQFEVRWDGSAFRLVGQAASETPTQSPAGKKLFSNAVPGTYTFTVPSVAAGNGFDVYWLYATCVGGGGGGAGCPASGSSTSGGGGGAGGAAQGWIQVTPGQSISYAVGAGGYGGAAGGVGANGGSSSVSNLLSATGGAFGGYSPPAGGAGGIGSGGQSNVYGGNGGDGSTLSGTASGGNGGASLLGGGGRTATFYNSAVSDGRAPGSGGGGTYSTTTGQSGGQGGNGAAGYVSFQY